MLISFLIPSLTDPSFHSVMSCLIFVSLCTYILLLEIYCCWFEVLLHNGWIEHMGLFQVFLFVKVCSVFPHVSPLERLPCAYTHGQQKFTQQAVFIHIIVCTCIHTCACNNNNNKELPTWGWKGAWEEFEEGQVGGTGGKKRRGESDVILFQSKYIHKVNRSHTYQKISKARWGPGSYVTLLHSSLCSNLGV